MLKRIDPQHTPGTRLAAGATVLIAATIAALMLMPAPPGADVVPDELAHLVAFAALALPLSLVRARFAVFVLIGVSAYGAGIEFLQPFFGRAGEWSDFGMDLAGALIGAAAGAAAGNVWRR